MPDLSILARNRVPEALTDARYCFRADGRRAFAIDPSGGTWWVEVDPVAREVSARRLPLTVPFDIEPPHLAFSHALDRLMVRTDRLRVYELPSGEIVGDAIDMPGQVVCLSPGGDWLIALDQERGWAMDLTRSVPRWVETWSLHQADPPGWKPAHDDDEPPETSHLYLDHVDELAVYPADREDRFWIAAACYGFVTVHLMEAPPGGSLWRVPGHSRDFGGLVYDPTELIRPAAHGCFFVGHGFGLGLAALEPITGEKHDCQIRPPRQQTYSFIRRVVTCGAAPFAYVDSGDGHFLWRAGERPVPIADPGRVQALYPDSMLCADDGGLVWRDLW